MNLIRFLASLLLPLTFSAAMAEKHALLIGIDIYRDTASISTLQGATNDANSLAKTLNQFGGFKKENIEVLLNSEATKSSIISALNRLTSRARPGDVVFFSFAGHGIELDKTPLLLAYDTVLDDETVTKTTSLETKYVSDALSKLKVDLLITAFDMCRDNPFRGSSRSPDNVVLPESIARDLKIAPTQNGPKETLNMFACSPGERSWEDRRQQRGYFSYELEQALRGQSKNPDGTVTAATLLAHLSYEVPTKVKKEINKVQHPMISFSGSGSFSLFSANNRVVRSELVFSPSGSVKPLGSGDVKHVRHITWPVQPMIDTYSSVSGFLITWDGSKRYRIDYEEETTEGPKPAAWPAEWTLYTHVGRFVDPKSGIGERRFFDKDGVIFNGTGWNEILITVEHKSNRIGDSNGRKIFLTPGYSYVVPVEVQSGSARLGFTEEATGRRHYFVITRID